MGEEIEEVDTERVDRLIMKNVGVKPVSYIAKLTGLKPEEVLRRKAQLLEEIDVLTVQQKRQKLLINLEEIAQDAMEKSKSINSEFFAGTLNAAVSAQKVILAEMARIEKNSSDEVVRLNEMRIRELMRLIDATVVSSVREIAATHGLEEAELMEIFQSKLSEEARALEEE